MQDTFARAMHSALRPSAAIGYLVYNARGRLSRPSQALYARYLCSRDALGLKAEQRYAAARPSAPRDDRVSCIQGQARITESLITEG